MKLSMQIEALLISSPDFVTIEKLYEIFNTDQVEDALNELSSFWAGRGMVIVRKKGAISLVPSPAYLKILLEVQGEVVKNLSSAAVETLCFIALNQPVTIADIEEARGLKLFKGLMDTLLDSGFVRASVRREDSGRAITYVTTDLFLEHFGLTSLTDLPVMDELPDLIGVPASDPS